jgi:glutathione synthase/RimK-type ligase-like ATP-grasp enzyme
LFFDKQLTYEKLSDHSIPTISLEKNTLKNINYACKNLANLINLHPTATDFSQDIIMKDRFGAGGRHVYRFKTGQSKDMLAIVQKNSQISFIIQPFTNFDQGFSYLNCPSSTDIRLIYLQDKIVQSYIRVAKSGDFRCNEHQGGSLIYLPLKDLPHALVTKSNSIAKILDKKCSLYALDFIISNNGNAYLLEGNTGPGLDWNLSLKKNEVESKKLIKLVVGELMSRVKINYLN